jgi:hypothetical protein
VCRPFQSFGANLVATIDVLVVSVVPRGSGGFFWFFSVLIGSGGFFV